MIVTTLPHVTTYFNPRTPRGVRPLEPARVASSTDFNPRTPRGVRRSWYSGSVSWHYFNPRTPRGVRPKPLVHDERIRTISIHAPREGCDFDNIGDIVGAVDFNPRTPRGVRPPFAERQYHQHYFNPRTPRGVRQQTLPKSREFARLNLLICTRGRRLSIQKQTRLCSIKLSFMLFGCEPAGEGVSSWTSHATKSKVRLEGRSA